MFAWLLPPDSDHAMIHLGNYNCSVCTYSLALCSTWQIAQLWPPKWVITWQQGRKSKHVSRIRLLKIVKRMTTWKNTLCWPCEGCKVSEKFFSFPSILSWAEWRHINSLAPTYGFKMAAFEFASFKVNFFRIAGTSGTEISLSGKVEVITMFNCYRQRQIW